MALADPSHLLELLQRSVDEIKAAKLEAVDARDAADLAQRQADTAQRQAETAQRQAETAQRAADIAQEQLSVVQQQLADAQTQLTASRAELDAARLALIDAQTQLDRQQVAEAPQVQVDIELDEPPGPEDRTSVGGDDPGLMLSRLQGLQEELATQEAEKRALKSRVNELEIELSAPRTAPVAMRLQSELEHELSNVRQQLIVEQARGADLLTRLHAWEARANELEHAMSELRFASDQTLEQLNAENAALKQRLEHLAAAEPAAAKGPSTEAGEGQSGAAPTPALAPDGAPTEPRATPADDQTLQRLAEATQRITQLEGELGAVKARRDALNLEIGKVENDRKAARARIAELEAAAASQSAERDNALRDALAAAQAEQQRVETQRAEHEQRAAEAERQLAEVAQRVLALTSQLATSAEHQRLLEDTVLSANEQLEHLRAQVVTANEARRSVERQYEQLHKELLTVLDQRDEARRLLAQPPTPAGVPNPPRPQDPLAETAEVLALDIVVSGPENLEPDPTPPDPPKASEREGSVTNVDVP